MMRALLRLVPILSCLWLVACGGGGSSGGAAQPPQAGALTIQTTQSTLGVNSLTDVIVTATRHGGGAVADGTTISLSVSPANLGQVGAASGENQSFNNSATATTSGGQARFRFKSTQATGTATVRASMNDPNSPSQTVTASTNVALNGGPSNDNRLTLQATRLTIPVNVNNIDPFIGSPYEVEVTATWRNLRGELVVPPEAEDAMGAAWNSPDNIGGISRPDDPETTDVNEYLQLYQAIDVGVNSGRGTIFVRSTDTSGTGRLTVAVVDLDTGENLSATLDFTMSSGAPALPASVEIVQHGSPAYVVGSGGPTSRQLQIHVNDGAGTGVPNPGSGANAFNNVRLEILNPQGERLSTTSASGAVQEGTVVNTTTANGIAGAVFLSSTRQGTITVRATADRADNNVDNGITDPVTGDAAIVVSDGRLFSVTLTIPSIESLIVGRQDIILPDDDDEQAPPDGTYSLIVGAIATDRLGNPVLPGTELQFGLIDSPTTGFPDNGGGTFALFGLNGDPQEGGTLFTAPGGAFTSAGGGAGPGDTLALFGKDVAGNADHEGSRVVASVNSATSLTVTRRFNFNDHTGQSVNSGAVIPYVVGRAQIGNISASATTNELGVATTTMNYPVSQLGRSAVIWVQGNGPVVSGQPKTVGDVEIAGFYGLAPAILSVSPTSITANTTANVLVCLADARNEPIQGVDIAFGFENLATGTGSADGQSGSGTVGPTGASGCVNVTVTTSGIQAGQTGDEGPRLTFFAGGEPASVAIIGGTEPVEPTEPFTLIVNIEGEGDVRVNAAGSSFSPPQPGNVQTCIGPGTCSYELAPGTDVTLIGLPHVGASFGSWSGDCDGPNATVTIIMDGDRTCTATFE